jgi:hypothetical protein
MKGKKPTTMGILKYALSLPIIEFDKASRRDKVGKKDYSPIPSYDSLLVVELRMKVPLMIIEDKELLEKFDLKFKELFGSLSYECGKIGCAVLERIKKDKRDDYF